MFFNTWIHEGVRSGARDALWQHDRDKRKTIKEYESKRSIIKYRTTELVKRIEIIPTEVSFNIGDIPTEVKTKDRSYYKGYPILLESEFTHNFCSKTGLYLFSSEVKSFYTNFKNVKMNTRDMSQKFQWIYSRGYNNKPRAKWSDGIKSRVECSWVKNKIEKEMALIRAIE